MRSRHLICMVRSPKFDAVWVGSLNLIFATLSQTIVSKSAHQRSTIKNTVKPRYTVQLGSRGFERYAVWKRYIASSLINRCKGLNQLFSLSITT